MAVTELSTLAICLNRDKEFELADYGFALIYYYEMHASD